MATKRLLPTGRWQFTIRRKILPRPVYRTFDDPAEGDQYCRQVEQLLDQGIIPTELLETGAEVHTVAEAIGAYLRANHVPDSDAAVLGVIRERQGAHRLLAINYPWAEAWVAGQRQAGAAPSTIRHHVGALARCFDWLIRSQSPVLLGNPLRMLPRRYATTKESRDQERDRRLLPGEEERIRAVLAGGKPEKRQRPLELHHGAALICLFDLALETAMRLREMYTLSRDQIDLPRRTIFLDKTKNGDKRQVPLSSVAVQSLTDYLPDGPAVFPWWDGSPRSLSQTTSLLSRQFSRVFSAAQCEGLRFHDLRHEATCRLYERTSLSDLQISIITGHKDLRMLKRYANLRGSDLARQLW